MVWSGIKKSIMQVSFWVRKPKFMDKCRYAGLSIFRCFEVSSKAKCLSSFCVIAFWFTTRTRLQRHSGLACLEISSRNEEAINSTRNMIYSLKVFYFLHYRRRHICFWIDLVRVLATTKIPGSQRWVAGYTRVINTRKFKGLDSRKITSLPDIEKVIYMARHFINRMLITSLICIQWKFTTPDHHNFAN